jgi:putative peptidoglycan lipid II flippase
VLPVTVISYICSEEIVHLLFVRGAFGESAWIATSVALKMSILGLPGMACSTVVMRGLYALGLAKGAFYNTLISVVCTLLSSLILLMPFGLAGLAIAPSIAFTIASIAGILEISKELSRKERTQGRDPLPASIKLFQRGWVIKIMFCLVTLAVFTIFLQRIFVYDISAVITYRALSVFSILASGVLMYAIVTYLLKFDEWHWLRGAIRINKKDSQN